VERIEFAAYHHALVRDLKKYIQIRGKKVLIIGCGDGLECELVRRCGAKEVIGIDIREITYRYRNAKIKYMRASAEAIPLISDYFDICFSIATFEHIQNPKAALKNMIRVALKNAIIYISAGPLWNSPFGHHKKYIFPDEPWIHVRKKTPEEMLSYCKNINYKLSDKHRIEKIVGYIYSTNYNRRGVKEYKDMIAEMLPVADTVCINFYKDYKFEKLLTPEISNELKGFDKEELFTASFKSVLRKR
jgi:ubiquinone/menaquinone biosynthesis C-methylase UbiE